MDWLVWRYCWAALVLLAMCWLVEYEAARVSGAMMDVGLVGSDGSVRLSNAGGDALD